MDMQTTQLKEEGGKKAKELISYEITIEENPDNWRGGFEWSVSMGDEVIGSGLEFSRKLAEEAANGRVFQLTQIDLHKA
jgi:dsRNA-specific ribonuclease